MYLPDSVEIRFIFEELNGRCKQLKDHYGHWGYLLDRYGPTHALYEKNLFIFISVFSYSSLNFYQIDKALACLLRLNPGSMALIGKQVIRYQYVSLDIYGYGWCGVFMYVFKYLYI